MARKAIQLETASSNRISRWERVGQKLAALAEEIPETPSSTARVDGVRALADVLRHVAFWNRYAADSGCERKAYDTANELPKDEFSTKTPIVAALKRSTADASEALKEHKSGLSPEMVEMRATFIEHYCDITADWLCTPG